MTHPRVRILALLALTPVWAAPGCVAPLVVGAAAGGGAVAYSRGELNGVALARLDQTMPVVIDLVQSKGWEVRQWRQDATDGFVRARRGDGTQVDLTLTRRGGDATGLSIRIGVFGDERASRQLLEEIQAAVRARVPS